MAEETGRIAFINYYTRTLIRQHPTKFFVFGDNVEQRGFGGQAREARGEHNAIGIPTKWAPRMDDDAFFKDAYLIDGYPRSWPEHGIIVDGFQKVWYVLDCGKDVIFPLAGIGTDRAQLRTRAPKLFALIQDTMDRLQQHFPVIPISDMLGEIYEQI